MDPRTGVVSVLFMPRSEPNDPWHAADTQMSGEEQGNLCFLLICW